MPLGKITLPFHPGQPLNHKGNVFSTVWAGHTSNTTQAILMLISFPFKFLGDVFSSVSPLAQAREPTASRCCSASLSSPSHMTNPTWPRSGKSTTTKEATPTGLGPATYIRARYPYSIRTWGPQLTYGPGTRIAYGPEARNINICMIR